MLVIYMYIMILGRYLILQPTSSSLHHLIDEFSVVATTEDVDKMNLFDNLNVPPLMDLPLWSRLMIENSHEVTQ